MISEKERESHKDLFKLMMENPDLPVIPFVDSEVVAGDEFSSWMGSWGSVRVDEYLLPRNDCCPVLFKSDNDVFDTLESYLPSPEFDVLPESEAECRKFYDVLPWVKAIIVSISSPNA